MSVIIGIDTSCYTTSVCAVDENETLIGDFRKVLDVKQGNRGLRQSEAVFQHLNNLPNLISQLFSTIDRNLVSRISVSASPRPVEGSYMPVFMASTNIGDILASSLGVPMIKVSHQEGHIRAGIWSAGGPGSDEFLALHLSGGTTEVLKVKKQEHGYKINIVGETTDISAGQLIDRVGVQLGLSFPSGRQLEELALGGSDNFIIPSSVKGLNVSFSGAETLVLRKIKDSKPEDVAFGVQKCIAKTLEKVISKACEEYNLKDVLLVGGVASNKYIKEFLTEKLFRYKIFYGEPKYSVDNSVGVALLGVNYAKANFNGK